MLLFYGLLAVYFAANVVLCVGVLYAGIVIEKERVSGPELAMMVTLLLTIGWPIAVYLHNSEQGGDDD